MDCLRDYIGLTGCGANVPASGLFINSLPGISLKSIDSLADSEQINYIGVWNDVQTRALKRLELSLLAELSKKVKVKTAKYQTSTFAVSDGTVVTTGISSSAILFKTDCQSSLQYHWIGAIKIDTIQIGNNYDVLIKDWDTGEIIFTQQTLAFNEDPLTIHINQKIYRQNILMTVTISDNQFMSYPMRTVYHDCGSIQFGKINGGNYIDTQNAYGINLIGYSVGCDVLNIGCDNKSILSLPLWYMLGSELMMETMVSPRVNFWTMDKKQAEELKAFYDVESEKALKLAFEGITMADCDCCMECNPPIAIREASL